MARAPKKVRHVIPVSGKDSLATAIVQRQRQPGLPYEYVFCDVGLELPETYQWLGKVEKVLGIRVNRIGKNLEQYMAEVGMIPSHTHRFCTKYTKIVPYQKWIESQPDTDIVMNYVGFRFDEKDRVPKGGIDRLQEADDGIEVREVYPLIEEEISVKDVYRIVSESGIGTPDFFWQRLYDEVYERCGPSSQKFLEDLPPWTRSYLFNWRSRSNCYCCFYQRLYEWVGLLEHHPELYADAERLEATFGRRDSVFRLERHGNTNAMKDFNFNPSYSLGHIRKEAVRLFEARVKDVYDEVVENRQKPRMELDLLSSTSCGAYCGK